MRRSSSGCRAIVFSISVTVVVIVGVILHRSTSSRSRGTTLTFEGDSGGWVAYTEPTWCGQG
jgi:hypothetical protein